MTTGTFHCSIAGVSKKNSDGNARQDYIRMYCHSGKAVELRPEPDNPYDKNAIGCWIRHRVFLIFPIQAQIGYIPADVAAELAAHLRKGGRVDATIANVTGGTRGKQTFGVNLQLRKA